jgi:CheY-like chemotaxis protein
MPQAAQPPLVVVEDPLISNLVRTLLRRQNYPVTASGITEALALLRRPESFQGILITNNPSLFIDFAENLRLLYLSSVPDPLLEGLFPRCRVVRKPFAPSDLIQAVQDLEAM